MKHLAHLFRVLEAIVKKMETGKVGSEKIKFSDEELTPVTRPIYAAISSSKSCFPKSSRPSNGSGSSTPPGGNAQPGDNGEVAF